MLPTCGFRSEQQDLHHQGAAHTRDVAVGALTISDIGAVRDGHFIPLRYAWTIADTGVGSS